MLKLNSVEKLKLKRSHFDYLKDISLLDLENLNEEDRFYLKSIGIYNFKVTPDICMIRIRIVTGDITISQLTQIVSISKKYNTKLILTVRGQIEFHKIKLQDTFNIYNEINSRGLNSYQTLSDNVRNIISDPLDSVGLSNKIEVNSIVKSIESIFLKKDEYIGTLPKKFNIAISGNLSNITPFFNNDLYFALAKKYDIYGFNIYLAGKNSQIAICADIFVQKDDVTDICEAIIKAYSSYGLRGTRNKTRLFHLIEKIGLQKFKEYIQEFYKKKFISSGEIQIQKEIFKDFIPIKNNKYCFKYQTAFGQIKYSEIFTIIEFAKKENLKIRFGNDQNIYIIGLKDKNIPFKNTQGSSNIIACAGIKYCFFSIFDVKEKSYELDIKKLEKYNITLGYSGCLKGCGKHRFCDIGLISIRTNTYGTTEQAVRFFLGGIYTKGKAVSRLIFSSVPLRELNGLIDIIIDEFINSKFSDFEKFSQSIINIFSEEFLAIWFLYKVYTKKKVYLKFTSDEKQYLEDIFKGNNLSKLLNKNLKDTIKVLQQKVWNQ